MERSQNYHKYQKYTGHAFARIAKQIGRYDGSSKQFLENLLAVQCFLGQADSGAILLNNEERSVSVLAVYQRDKKEQSIPAWLNQAATIFHEVAPVGNSIVKPLHEPDEPDSQPPRRHILFVPLKMVDIGRITAAFLIDASDNISLQTIRERLELTSNLLGLYEKRFLQQTKEADLMKLQKAMETLSAINRLSRFTSTAMAFCNEVASQWQCDRVSIGFPQGRYVRVKAISHTEDFSRKMQIVQDMESAMEECLDQNREILYPSDERATYIHRAAAELSKKYGPLSVLSVPLRQDGDVRAVLTLEREPSKALSLEEIEIIRLTCELCSSRLLDLYERDRWFGARLASKVRSVFATLVGSRHTWAKVAAILIFGAILFLIFAKGQYRAKAPFVLEATYLQIVPVPFDGYIKDVKVEIGDEVQGGETVLAELDTVELRLQLAAAKAEKAGYLKQVAAAMRDGETAQAQIAQANADKAQAQIDLLNYQIEQAKIVSSISGVVVKGDLKHEIGAPVKTGDTLFEVTPLESIRSELMVPEDQIYDIKVGQEGYLATASYPSQRIKFEVERISPMAEVVNKRNVFKVRVRLLENPPWMRPGMEGVAKISIGKRHYVWIWTRKIVNWIRMKLWL